MLFKQAASLFSVGERFFDRNFLLAAALLLCINLGLSLFIISRVPYTEIDWVAYMEEVSGVLNERQFDYRMLRGGTGPLVYPAGFVYVFSVLYYLTDGGRNVRTAQYIFAVLHSVVLALVLSIYRKCYTDLSDNRRFPIWIVCFLLVSRRVMSLFVLRLFNDSVQMLFMYTAIALFMSNKWNLGCLVFSLSVSIKMNALLFAPGVAVLLCQALGTGGAIRRIFGICLTSQLLLGAPFLLHAPKSYLTRAFEITRQFLYKWSVNGSFLAESVFLDKRLAIILLGLHFTALALFGHMRWTSKSGRGLPGLLHFRTFGQKAWLVQFVNQVDGKDLNPSHVARVLLTSNFIGIVFARTLHYQFYLWYAHSLPLLVWWGSSSWTIKVLLLFVIEAVFNVYPPHPLAASSLHIAHLILLVSLWNATRATNETIYEDLKEQKPTKDIKRE